MISVDTDQTVLKSNTLYGDSGNDNIVGAAGADILDGGAGNDYLAGGDGFDQLIGGIGHDQLFAEFGSTLYGGDGSDSLYLYSSQGAIPPTFVYGGTGIDTIKLYFQDKTSDMVVDIGTGTAFNGKVTLDGVEQCDIRSGSGDDLLIGGNRSDTLTSIGGNDTLYGMEGEDELWSNGGTNMLYGGAGADDFYCGIGSDNFVFDTTLGPTEIDIVREFDPEMDTIILDSAIFTVLSPGSLPASAFVNSHVARDKDDRIVLNTVTLVLSYDPDGAGGAAAQAIATILPLLGTTLSASDFLII